MKGFFLTQFQKLKIEKNSKNREFNQNERLFFDKNSKMRT